MSQNIPPMQLSITDLRNVMSMAEASIKSAEFSQHLFGNDDVVQIRAISSDMQARCQREILRQEMLAEEKKQVEAQKVEERRRVEEEAKKSAEKLATAGDTKKE